ncbi:hypothetical protein [Streptomyces olivochromogenes]|uniref:hypothetical protein n=1 Tax=Streptomyces olivochromogenes TaxID=1963 RepID=UPI001F466D06|nr:hypothetical protein [Streptomyces olivochromogenes]MCF3133668.1 hypothetical protein [Streptomyces olivochromogenes]
MSFVKRIATAAGVTALLLGGALATAGPAAAGPNCASGYHCVFLGAIQDNTKHSYFNSDTDFTNDTFVGAPSDVKVNDYVSSASNSSNSGYESHYYYDINYGGGLVFCVNPGSSVDLWSLTDDGTPGNGKGQRDEASSLRVRSTTSIPCF